jgi:hypothetical protein
MMGPQQLRAARDALYSVSVIADILQKIAAASISAGVEINGTEGEWLAQQLETAEHDATSAIMGHSPAGAA